MESMFYQNLYTRDDNVDPNIIIEEVQHCVDDHMNDGLCKQFSEEEISDALFQIGPLKAPGPDGFPAHFLQRNWGLFRDEVVRVVQTFFVIGVMPSEVNETSIVMIPKRRNQRI
jgi:hypothetical protein